MNKPPTKIFLLLAIVLVVSGCASSRSGEVYSRHEARQEMQVEFGVVEHMRSVLIETGAAVMFYPATGINQFILDQHWQPWRPCHLFNRLVCIQPSARLHFFAV